MNSEWDDDILAGEYSASSDDAEKNWYEREVNIPSLLKLLPDQPTRVLDFGCGPGNFTNLLRQKFDVTGADASTVMIKLAQQKLPDSTFFVWDGQGRMPGNVEPFDAIVTKLTLEFIDNLPQLARNLRAALRPDGLLVFSVQHPLLAIISHPENDIPYWQSSSVKVQIGSTGHYVTKIHRNLQNYLVPFIENGFELLSIDEPEVPKLLSVKYPITPIDFKIPKRLNVQFRAI